MTRRNIALWISVAVGGLIAIGILGYVLTCDHWSGEARATCERIFARIISGKAVGFFVTVLGFAGVWAALRTSVWRRLRSIWHSKR